MYIYNKKLVNMIPNIQNTKKINVALEDVLLTFLNSEIKGSNIIISYSISYFNIPQNVREFEIEKHIDVNSLQSVIKETVGELGKFITIKELSAKLVKFEFDVLRFLKDASYPTNIINHRKINQITLKLNKKVPELVKQTSGELLGIIFSKVMTTIIRNERKYTNIFSHMRNWKFSRLSVLTAVYNSDSNDFFVQVDDPISKIMYYYL